MQNHLIKFCGDLQCQISSKSDGKCRKYTLFHALPPENTHLARRHIHRWSPARGSCRYFGMDCSHTDGSWFLLHSGHLRAAIVYAASINKTTDEDLVLSMCLINHISCRHMAQWRHSATHYYYVKVGSFIPWQIYPYKSMPVIRTEPLVTGHPACWPVTILAELPEVSTKVTVQSIHF